MVPKDEELIFTKPRDLKSKSPPYSNLFIHNYSKPASIPEQSNSLKISHIPRLEFSIIRLIHIV